MSIWSHVLLCAVNKCCLYCIPVTFILSLVSIKVPWGHIAGKVWGHSNGQPVLALHGKLYTLHMYVYVV